LVDELSHGEEFLDPVVIVELTATIVLAGLGRIIIVEVVSLLQNVEWDI